MDSARFPARPLHGGTNGAHYKVKKPEAALEFVDDHLVEDDTLGLLNAVDAVRISQSARDTIFLSTDESPQPLRFGDGSHLQAFALASGSKGVVSPWKSTHHPGSRQNVTFGDLNAIQDYAARTFEDVVSDLLVSGKRVTPVSLSTREAARRPCRVGAGRLYSAGRIFRS